MDLQKRQKMLEEAKKRITSLNKAPSASKKDGRLSARERMNLIFDEGSFSETGAYIKARGGSFFTSDPDDYEGVICGYGAIDGRLVFAYSEDAFRQNGAFGSAAAEKICALFDMAKKNAAPVISVFDSNGAKLTEGLDVLDGYGKVMKKVSEVKGKLPLLSYICGNTSGMSAVIASMSDIVIMAGKNTTFSLSPVSVLKTNGADEKIGLYEYAAEKGIVTIACETEAQAFEKGKEALYYLPSNKLDKNIYTEVLDNPERETPEIADIVANEGYDMHKVISAVADSGKYLELSEKSGTGIIIAFAVLNGIPCGIVATSGKNLCFGSITKAKNFINLCNSFQTPIITLVDCKGFSYECEAKGARITMAAAELALAYTSANIPLVTVNIGAAYGGIFTMLGSKSIGADIVYALDSAKIAVMNPESGVQFMWNDRLAKGVSKAQLEKEWKISQSAPLEAARSGYVDDIIGAGLLRKKLLSAVEMLSMKSEFNSLF